MTGGSKTDAVSGRLKAYFAAGMCWQYLLRMPRYEGELSFPMLYSDCRAKLTTSGYRGAPIPNRNWQVSV